MAPPVFSLAMIFGMNNFDIIGYPLKSVKKGECTLWKTMRKMQLIFSNSIQGKSLALSLYLQKFMSSSTAFFVSLGSCHDSIIVFYMDVLGIWLRALPVRGTCPRQRSTSFKAAIHPLHRLYTLCFRPYMNDLIVWKNIRMYSVSILLLLLLFGSFGRQGGVWEIVNFWPATHKNILQWPWQFLHEHICPSILF